GEPIAGPHAVLEAIRAGRVVKRLFVSNERGTQTGPVAELIQEAQQRRIFIRFVDAMEISRLSPIESHQGVVAIAEGKAGVELEEFLLHLDALSEPALVLLIDSLQDPQNFGVLLRSAEGTGVDGVVIPKHRAVGLTPAVAKTSAGASEHLMIAEVANLRQADEAELQADLAQDERNTSEPMAVETDAIALGATQGAEDEGDADEAPPNEAEEATPKKRAPRARKAPTTKKPAARKKSAE